MANVALAASARRLLARVRWLKRPRRGWRSYVPWEEAYRQRHRGRIRYAARRRVSALNDLTALDADVRRPLLQQVRHYAIPLAAADIWRNTILQAVSWTLVLALLGAYGGVPILVAALWLNVEYTTEEWLLTALYSYWISSLLASGIWLVPFFLIQLLPFDRQYVSVPRWLTLALPFAIVTFYSVQVYRIGSSAGVSGPEKLSELAAAGMVGATVYFGGTLIAAFMITAPLQYYLRRRKSGAYPTATVVCALTKILALTEKHRLKWADLRFKREIMSELESVAVTMERDWPRQLRSGDVVSDVWLAETGQRIAAAFRRLKKAIALSGPNTREQFIRKVADSLQHVASGAWDNLQRVEPERLSDRQLRRYRLLEPLRLVGIAGLPGALLWVFQETPLAFHGAGVQYASGGVFVWAAVVLLGALDPYLSEKLAVFKGVWPFPFPRNNTDQ